MEKQIKISADTQKTVCVYARVGRVSFTSPFQSVFQLHSTCLESSQKKCCFKKIHFGGLFHILSLTLCIAQIQLRKSGYPCTHHQSSRSSGFSFSVNVGVVNRRFKSVFDLQTIHDTVCSLITETAACMDSTRRNTLSLALVLVDCSGANARCILIMKSRDNWERV